MNEIPKGYWLAPLELDGEDLRAAGHINSEWLNDKAPLGESRYVMPIPAIWFAIRDRHLAGQK